MNLLQHQRLTMLNTQVKTVAPVDSLRVLSSDQAVPVIQIVFTAGATVPQQAAAQAIVDSWDWSQAGQDAAIDAILPERRTLLQQATAAVQSNLAYLDILSPSNAQVRDQVNTLTRQVNQIIRRFVEIN